MCLPDVVHKRRKINSDLLCLQKTGQVYVRVHGITYQRKTIITTVVQIVREKILNDKLKILTVLSKLVITKKLTATNF